jgi:hypothetical protein
MNGWVYFLQSVVADALILGSLLVFIMFGYYAFRKRTDARPCSSSSVELSQHLLQERERVPEMYKL